MLRHTAALAAVVLAGCAERRYEYAALCMGVEARVVLYASSEPEARRAAAAAFERIRELDACLSDWRADSELADLVRGAGQGPVSVGEDLWRVLAFGQEVARASGGAFDMTAAPAVALWREARRSGALPDGASLEAARARIGWRRIALDEGARRVSLEKGTALDLGALGKGYAADEALRRLAALGIERALVDLGGDLAAGEAPPGRAGWRVAVAGEERLIDVVRAGVAHSSDAAQFLEAGGARYSHIVDPRTGRALTQSRSVTVVAPNAMTADALASALSVLGNDEAAALLARFPESTAFAGDRRVSAINR